MTTVDTIVTVAALNAGPYAAGGAVVVSVTNQINDAQKKLHQDSKNKGFGGFLDSIKDGVGSTISALGPLESLIKAIIGVGVAGATGGLALMKQAAEFDSLRQSLINIEGDAKKAGKALSDLKELARAPGLGFEQAVRAYTGLRNADLSQQFSERLIREFANANARGGGGAETFGRIMEQVKQAAMKPYLAEEDLRPIAEGGIPINAILKQLYGTGDTEELKKKGITADKALHDLVDQLAKLPRVAGGAQNEFDNLGDALHFAAVSAGDALNQGLLPYISKLADGVGELSDSGVIQDAFATIADNVKTMLGDSGDDTAESLIPLVAALTTVSAGFRNLTENIKGFVNWIEDNFRHSIIGHILGLDKKKKGDDSAGSGTDLFSEYNRTVEELTARLEADRARRKKHPNSTKTAADDPDPSKPKKDETKPLLQRIAVAVEKTADVQARLFGGSTLASDATSQYGVHKALSRRSGSGLKGGLAAMFAQWLDDVEASYEAQGPANQAFRGRRR